MRYINLFILFLLISATACLSQPHPVKNHYLISLADQDGASKPAAARRTLLVGSVTAAAGFDNRGLIYKVGPDRFESDFYNEYAAPPARLLADLTTRYLDQSSSRFRVVKTPGLTLAQYGLETYLEALYGDYTGPSPRAVVVLRFTLNDLRGAEPRVVWDKTYRAETEMNEQSPQALVEAQGRALSDILTSLNRDISSR